MTPDPTVRQALAEAALTLAAARPWAGITVFDLAAAAGRPVADFYPLTAADAPDCVDELFDRAAAQGASAPDPASPERDRLFDVAMRRFEAMEERRAGVLAMEQAAARDPIAQAAAFAREARTARWLLALAGAEGEGAAGAARAQGFALVLRQTRAAWRKEDAGDFARTMAALDKGLRQAEEFVGQVRRFAEPFRPRARKPSPSAGGASPAGPPEGSATA